MADDNIALYNFYRRYKWLAEDFEGWQTGMVDLGRGMFEGLLGAAVLQGYDTTVPVTGMNLSINAGIACGPTGYLHVSNSPQSVSVPVPSTNPVRHLIVARAVLVDDTIITRPTVPFDLVPLRELQESQVTLISGIESSTPVYPSTQANDTVLYGLNIYPGATGITQSMLDQEQRDVPGKNSDFHQHNSKYDDRCRVYQVDRKTFGIKPSQTFGGRPRCFTYVNKGVHSNFPQGADFLFNTADTFLDFEAGTVTGGDAQTADFTPVIPSAGKFIVATVSLNPNDRLNIALGIEGTIDQCFDGIINKRLINPGAIVLPQNCLRLAFIILHSPNGSTLGDAAFMDARSTFYFGGADPQVVITQNFLGASAVVESDTTMFNPRLTLTGTESIVVQDRGRILGEDYVILLDSSIIIMQSGSTGRML